MAKDKQFREDSARLAALIEKYTNIPQDRVYQFFMENEAGNLLPFANKLCKNEAQRKKLGALIEFKKLYEIIKGAENREYRLGSTTAAMDYFIHYFEGANDREYFAVAYLDTKHKIIKTDTISTGTVASAYVYQREIYKEALFLNASGVMIAHNHPSGSLMPSGADLNLTEQIKQGLESIDLKLTDHIIVGGAQAVSLRDEGIILDKIEYQDLGKVATRANETGKKYRQTTKPQGIKQQMAIAEKQLALEAAAKRPQAQNRSDTER